MKDRGQRRCAGNVRGGKASHPDLVAEQDVVQGTVDAPERAGTFLPVLLVRQLGADLVKSLIGDVLYLPSIWKWEIRAGLAYTHFTVV